MFNKENFYDILFINNFLKINFLFSNMCYCKYLYCGELGSIPRNRELMGCTMTKEHIEILETVCCLGVKTHTNVKYSTGQPA